MSYIASGTVFFPAAAPPANAFQGNDVSLVPISGNQINLGSSANPFKHLYVESINVSGVAGVSGPASSTTNGIATYADTSGGVLLSPVVTLSSGTMSSSIPLTIQTSAGTDLGVTAAGSLNLQGTYTNVKSTNYIDLLVGGNLISQTTTAHTQFYQDIVPSGANSVKVGTGALPFSYVHGVPVLVDTNGVQWKLTVSTVGAITAVSGTF
jgi:hypothetical protein